MPDTSTKVFKGDFPSEDVVSQLRTGERFIWVPDEASRRFGCSPMLCQVLKGGHVRVIGDTMLMALLSG